MGVAVLSKILAVHVLKFIVVAVWQVARLSLQVMLLKSTTTLSHTNLSPTILSPATLLFHTQLSHPQLPHPQLYSFTHCSEVCSALIRNSLTHTISHRQLFHTQLSHSRFSLTHNSLHPQLTLSHTKREQRRERREEKRERREERDREKM